MNLNVPQVFEQSVVSAVYCSDVTVSMLVQYMNTELCNEPSMHTKAVNSSHNWRRTPVRQDQRASRKCAVARTYITRIIEDSLPHAFASRTLKTSTRFAHTTLQICSNEAQQNANFTPLAPSSAHRDRNAISFLNKIRFRPLLEALDDFRALLYSASFSRIFKNVNAFGALVLEHTQVLYGAAPLSFIYYEF